MVLLLEAVGALTLAKVGVVLGAYSGNNYDKNVKPAWERTGSLTDGFSIDQGKRGKARGKAAKAIAQKPEAGGEEH